MTSAAFSPIMETDVTMKKSAIFGKTDASTMRRAFCAVHLEVGAHHAALFTGADRAGGVVSPGVVFDEITKRLVAERMN
jgi:hypothetical protein